MMRSWHGSEARHAGPAIDLHRIIDSRYAAAFAARRIAWLASSVMPAQFIHIAGFLSSMLLQIPCINWFHIARISLK